MANRLNGQVAVITMTRDTQRKYVQPVFRSIALVVMPFLGLSGTLDTSTKGNVRQVAASNSMIDSIHCLNSLGVFFSLLAAIATIIRLTSFCLIVPFLVSLHLFFVCLAIAVIGCIVSCSVLLLAFSGRLAPAILTLRACPMHTILSWVKFRIRFSSLAFRAGLFYDAVRHCCFSIKQSCLGPIAGYIPVVGSLHSTAYPVTVKSFLGGCCCG